MHQLFFVFTNHIDMWVWMIFFTLYVMEGQADSIMEHIRLDGMHVHYIRINPPN